MLFRADIQPMCAYCRHSERINKTQAVCIKKGVLSLGASCGHFSYDPLKRVPERTAVRFEEYSHEDFEV